MTMKHDVIKMQCRLGDKDAVRVEWKANDGMVEIHRVPAFEKLDEPPIDFRGQIVVDCLCA